MKRLTKLKTMTTDELAHRLRERLRREADRVRFQLHMGRDREFAALIERHGSLKNYLLLGPARRFYASTQEREGLCGFIDRRYPEWLERTVQEAGRLCEHRVDLLGYTDIALGGSIDWHRDPISGHEWPKRYWADYELVQSPPADAKLIHELNRHQHLPRLAKAYFLTGDEPYAREALSQIESWIEQNPRWTGINWQSSLELAIRSISWMWTLFLLLPSESLDEEKARRICASLFEQLDHVYRYPSTYSSPNTHLIGEAAALFLGGLLFTELPRAEHWRQFGAITLLNEMQRQVSEDGVYCELSSYYHCYATDFYLQVFALSRWNRVPLPEWMWTRLSHMLEFVMHLSRADGTIPLLGDDDGGRVLAMSSGDYRSFLDGLCSGAVLFGRGDFKYQSRSFCEESLWLLGDDAWPIYNSVAPQPPSELRRNYAQAGYFIQRSGWEANDSHVVFDCGGLGAPTGGHGHADALSFTLFSGGHEFLIDPGTSVYNCAPEWRTFFRSTSAHNTVVVDGTSQSETNGTFSWKRKAEARLLRNISLPGMDYIDAEHDGFARHAKDVTHRRRLVYVRPNYWIVLDDLRGRGEHDYEFLYHFAPEAELTVFGDEQHGEIDCRARIDKAGLQMLLYASAPMQAEAVCGQTHPIQGWSSRRYCDRLPSPVLRASMRGFTPAGVMSFVIPGAGPSHSRRFQGGGGRVIAAALRNSDYDDVAVMSMEDADMQLLDCSMRGEFFWMRLENGTLKQMLAVNARKFSYAGERIFESAEVIPYVQAYFWDNGMVIERGEDEGKVYVRDMRDRQFQRN
jgi:hypothetical protein